jgi:hypothetical protein
MAKFRPSKKALAAFEREIEAFERAKSKPSLTKGAKLKSSANTLIPGARKADYAVGYGKPPVHSRIKPGQILNPAGRGKGKRGFKTEFREFIKNKSAKMRRGGKLKKISAFEASFEVLWEKIIKGDMRAISLFHNLAERYHNEEPTSSNTESNELDDEILNNFIERQISERAAKNEGDDENAPKDEGENDEALPAPK